MFKTQKPSGAESDEAKVLVDDIGVPAGSYDRNSAADGDRSVRKVKAKAYFLCFCFYNFCCCLPERLVGQPSAAAEGREPRWGRQARRAFWRQAQFEGSPGGDAEIHLAGDCGASAAALVQ